MVLLGARLKWKLDLVHLDIVLTLMKLLGDVRHVESRFDPFGDSVSVGA
jgi:hypothetical protein